MRIKGRPSLKKLDKEKPMNMTMASAIFSSKDIRQTKLPPLQNTMRKTTAKLPPPIKKTKERQQTQTTAMESDMFKSYYQAMQNSWVKPTEYMRDIQQLKLGGGELQLSNYQIKLNEKLQKNMAKIDSLSDLISKWTKILKKALSYLSSRKSNSPHLIEQVSFWRILSKKFDQLQYEFNDQKTNQLLSMAKNSVKAKPQIFAQFQEFTKLKDQAIRATPYLKKLHMSLQVSVAGNIQRFSQNSHIVSSVQYLKRILLGFKNTIEQCDILRFRISIVFQKINDSMIQKLNAAPLYPRQLANISGLKQKYLIIDTALSFYSNFLSAMEEVESKQIGQTMEKAEYTRSVLVNLLQILGYFEFLYKRKEVLQFSKLFSHQLDCVIYEVESREEWETYMEKVEESMERKSYEP